MGLIEEVGRKHGVEHPIQMTIATTDGRAPGRSGIRARETRARSSSRTDVPTVRKLHPDLDVLENLDDESRLIVSEPLRDLTGVWNLVPESMYGVVQPGDDEMHPFKPKAPSSPTPVPAAV